MTEVITSEIIDQEISTLKDNENQLNNNVVKRNISYKEADKLKKGGKISEGNKFVARQYGGKIGK